MRLHRNCFLAGAAVALAGMLPVAAQQAANTPWVHVSVVDEGGKATAVKVNLPFSAVEVALAAAPNNITEKVRLKLPKDISMYQSQATAVFLYMDGHVDVMTANEPINLNDRFNLSAQ